MNPASERPSAPPGASDLDLLRQFEPILRFTKGEQFYPMDVDRYVNECSLWEHHPDGHEELLVPQDDMNLEHLTACRPADFGTVRFLRFIEQCDFTEFKDFLGKLDGLVDAKELH